MNEIKGGCLCGSVRYQTAQAPLMSAVCHCIHCQKQSGSAFSTNVVVPSAGFEIAASTLATFNDVGESGAGVKRHFCRNCGSPVYTELDANPDVVAIKAGTLDDPSWVQPQVHMWRCSAKSWGQVSEGAVCFDRNPPA
ncbi:aldehyde-activating protein [Caballeronia jiangsuensis]|nr:aldehyde-activating protein [Caballeronia jiangsuensis]